MDTSSKKTAWIVVAIVVVLLIIGGIWMHSKDNDSYMTDNGSYASTTDMTATDTAMTTGNGAPAGTTATKPVIAVKLTYVGGVCPNGQICKTEKYVTTTGDYYVNGYKQFRVNQNDTNNLIALMNSANYATIRAKAYTGACPPTTNGSQLTYTFYTSHGAELVSNCQTTIDYTAPLFKAAEVVFPNVN